MNNRYFVTIVAYSVILFLYSCVLPPGYSVDSIQQSTMMDDRDGKEYKTVEVNNQILMAENLNYITTEGNSWCYDNQSFNCSKYGRLYNIKSAKNACPKGWSLPHQILKHQIYEKFGGYRDSGSFYDINDFGFWWFATEDYSGFYVLYKKHDGRNMQPYNELSVEDGFSVRCIKD
ncbi:hypothetical protein AGMMS49938_17910 [Fibrobacterales bacterium]|nr:hypothetical protein AGMMS49938_17910 [Fibrobacterales bacterium]